MALIERPTNELEWPARFGARRLLDWPDSREWLADDSEIRVEEYIEDGRLVVLAEIPGIDPDDDVEITIEDSTLHLRAERHAHVESESRKGYRSEFRYGSLARSVPLPSGATEEDVRASYADGILEVRIPIDTDRPEAKKIPIARS